MALLTVPTAAHADRNPAAHAARQKVARITNLADIGPLRTDLWVYSPSNHKKMKVNVLTPANSTGPRSVVYMLDGADAGADVSDWITKGRAGRFFANKNVTVVLPAGGKGTFYTNWRSRDPNLGKPQWETFLTEELPPLIDKEFNGTGRNAIVGLSMGGQAALALAARFPKLYTGVASLSGCPEVYEPANQAYVHTTVANAGGNAINMWGPPRSPAWKAHDPGTRLDKLRGKNIYLSSGSGLAGPLDLMRKVDPEEGTRQSVTASASALELGAWRCSINFALELRKARIPFTDGLRLVGTHYWGYWEQDLPRMWPTIAQGL
ncbi:alpha/beta hydrolase family protein [Gordonia sp. (in: high G+C Gram-positive bacteria)]|uniref:alpha/beta hydrolase n=1 Tax=Gordonia sp. (in: high G+C Gram-positive bacteria) TaxID=84139 RepID=UPI0025C6095C|nr:alpha/beta hydrolase family protein [Gordonia sp. (in: high G+C Gram-positive bacteria)]HMS77754.1 alpha/beta hydrolase family protein [Gordonia sp. (in: high G+C Gram-positive bacteria)]HQV19551.1 alpha/beta hydrolase family protein [Gordonia sp. (in: high G+C Gram-positive bacteria)]